MGFKSISFKLIGSMLLITTLILSGLGYFKYTEAEKVLREDLRENVQLLFGRLKLNLPPAIWNIDDEYIRSALEAEAKARFINGIYIEDEKGRLVDGIERTSNGLQQVDEMPASKGGMSVEELSYIDRDAEETYQVGKVLIAITDKQVVAQLDNVIKTQATQVAVLNAILLLLFSVVISRMTSPLGTLRDLASSISQGDYELDINIKRSDEIGALADSFTVMKEGIRKKVQDLKDLNGVSEILATTNEQQLALQTTLTALAEHCHVNSSSVYLLNEETQSWEIALFAPQKEGGKETPKVFSLNEGIVGVTGTSKKVIYVPNTSTDERFASDSDESAFGLICVPLVDEDKCIGVLNFSGTVDEVQFGETDYEFAETIARQLVVTLKNIRMREEIEEHNRNLEVKVQERTVELHQKNQDIASMMQNMHQGLFTITAGGDIHHEYAAFLEEIFETQEIAGVNFSSLLFDHCKLSADAIDQNITGVDAIVGEDEMMFGFNEHCLVPDMTILINNKEKILELDWDPIVVDDVVEKLMVTVRDVTELRVLQAEAEAQKLELSMIGELLAVDASKAGAFFENSIKFIDDCTKLIEQTKEKDLDVIAELFRSMHTVKGNARTYGFVGIKDVVHEVESTYDDLRKNEAAVWEQAQLLSEISVARNIVEHYYSIFSDKLGMTEVIDSGIDLEPEQVRSWLDEVQRALYSGEIDRRSALLGGAYRMLVTAQAKPLGSILDSVCDSVQSIAKQLGKAAPIIEISDEGVLIENDLEETLNNIFMHVFRNAIDHGIESSQERVEKDKPEQGKIALSVNESSEALEIVIRDDGRGIAIDKVYGLAIEKGIYQGTDPRPTDSELANLIFSSGFSTADTVSDVSGRGVGMDAVKSFLEQEGGSIAIELDAQESAAFMSFSTVIKLPLKFIYHQDLAA